MRIEVLKRECVKEKLSMTKLINLFVFHKCILDLKSEYSRNSINTCEYF